MKTNKDRVFVLRDGDLNPLEGTLGGIDPIKQTIKFKYDVMGIVKEIEPQLEKIQGMQFVRTDPVANPSLCKVIDVDGSMVVATSSATPALK